MSDPLPYRAHRQRALARLAELGAAALVPTARAKARNHDSEYRFRPDSDFWWLTGFAEPQSALLLLPAHGDRGARSVLFLRDSDRAQEIWSGRRLGVAAAPEALGVDEAHPIGELWKRAPELLKGHSRLVYRAGGDEERDRELFATLARLRSLSRSPLPVPQEVIDPSGVLHELRLFKDEPELARMRRAAEITAAAHVAAMREVRPGARENEIEARIEYEFRRRGATGAAYGTIVAGGANACVLHYVDNSDELRDGDLLLVDAGAEHEYYASDVTRTYPVNGRFDDVHAAALRTLVAGLCELGLLDGPPELALESESYKRFYMHRTSHWLGLDVHDCGSYVEQGRSRALAPGQVLTVEPGLYIAPDEASVEPRWRGIGIRVEDDVLITAKGNEVLTAAIPKSIGDLERTCGADPAP
jgi:Xaa-Pro aminopeptidase